MAERDSGSRVMHMMDDDRLHVFPCAFALRTVEQREKLLLVSFFILSRRSRKGNYSRDA